MDQTIFKYSLKPGEPTISQGDIFNNLPFFSYDFLLRSGPGNLDSFKNDNLEILNDVIQNSNKVQFEGFYYPRWGIIASQDCDIKPKKDLIFYLLEETTRLIDVDDIIVSVDNKIKNSTRRLYLPQIVLPENHIYGPFEIIFHIPFTIPYEIISNNLKNCWRARLIDSARKIYIGKLSQFFTRLPIGEFIFLENKEITKYLVRDWEKFWKSKNKNYEQFKNRVKRIIEILETLKYVERSEDISKIFYFDVKLVENIKKMLMLIKWFSKVEKILNCCNEILGAFEKNEMKANLLFEELITDFLINEDSLVNQFNNYYNKNLDEIQEMRKSGKIVEGILPDQILKGKEEYKNCASQIFKTKSYINNVPEYLKEYVELFDLLNKEIRKSP